MIITNISPSIIVFQGSNHRPYEVSPNGGQLVVSVGIIPDVEIAELTLKGYITTTGWNDPVIEDNKDRGSHTYGYVNGLLTTDTWLLSGVTRIKTYAYSNGSLISESDWI